MTLSDEEKAFFRKEQPWGFIVFGRNIETPSQLSELVASLKACVEHEHVAILIDQEGGRVQRMKQPHWRKYPATRYVGKIFAKDREKGLRAAWLHGRLLASDLHAVGINVDCAPVLDVPVEGADEVTLGDRTFSADATEIGILAEQTCAGLIAGGVAPIIKHMPGLGRAETDSHYNLPIVDCGLEDLSKTDFVPFKHLNQQKMAMTAHIIYKGVDAENPATQSQKIIGDIIRGQIGFDGLLMSDDVSMKALKGDFETRCEKTFNAGCDMVLHCNGDMQEMMAVASASPKLAGKSQARASRAIQSVGNPDESDISSLQAEYEELLSGENWPPVG